MLNVTVSSIPPTGFKVLSLFLNCKLYTAQHLTCAHLYISSAHRMISHNHNECVKQAHEFNQRLP